MLLSRYLMSSDPPPSPHCFSCCCCCCCYYNTDLRSSLSMYYTPALSVVQDFSLTSPDDALVFRIENSRKINLFFPTQPRIPVFLVFSTRDVHLCYYSARGCTNKGVEMPISVNTGVGAEVMLAQTLETGGGGCGCISPHWR